jgi:hypothetical protein
MNTDNIITEKREKRESFSVHSLINEYKLSEEEAKKICLESSKDDRVSVYYFVLCQNADCKANISEGRFDSSVIGKQRNCYFCKNKFIVSNKDLEFVYDTRTLREKMLHLL